LESRVVEDLSQLSALQDAWRGLQPSVRYPFQELGWYLAWARTIGTTGGRRLKCITLWDGARLVAVLPLALRRYKGIRLVEWIGGSVTDYCDAIVAPGVDAQDALATLWRTLNREVGFDVLRLGQVRADAVVSGFADSVDPWVETREGAFSIPLKWSSSEEWLKSRNQKQRYEARRLMRQMDKEGFQFRAWKAPEPLEPMLAAVIEQKQAWVRARGVDSFITEPQGPEFVYALAREMAALGMLHLTAIQHGDRFISCHLGFERGDTLYYWMPTYDAAFAKKRVGNTLREHLIMSACDRGMKKFDMLLGAYEYKSLYDAVEDPMRTLVVPRGLLGRATVAYYRFAVKRKRMAATPEAQTEEAAEGA
jgi:CelD/BcsL family acetyltransferase involved in cellulose biosynthesis